MQAVVDRALAARELRRALVELCLHPLASDHDDEVLVADAVEGEGCQFVEVLDGSSTPTFFIPDMNSSKVVSEPGA